VDKGLEDPLKVSCVPDSGEVDFYTLSGETVRKVAPIGQLAHWDGRNAQGAACSSGIYFFVAQDQGKTLQVGKLLLLNGR
jgi:hypothetical protein